MSSHDLGDGSTQTLDWNDLWPCVRELYMVRRSREILCPAWLYGHERDIFYYAFSCLGHGPYVRCSIANLANCRFTLVLLHCSKLLINVDQRQSSSSITVSSTGRGAAKKAIDIGSDLLLTETVQQAAMRLSCQTMARSYYNRHYVDQEGLSAGTRQLAMNLSWSAWIGVHGLHYL